MAYADFIVARFLGQVVPIALPLTRDHLAIITCFLMASFVQRNNFSFYFIQYVDWSDNTFCFFAVTNAEYNVLSPGPLLVSWEGILNFNVWKN